MDTALCSADITAPICAIACCNIAIRDVDLAARRGRYTRAPPLPGGCLGGVSIPGPRLDEQGSPRPWLPAWMGCPSGPWES